MKATTPAASNTRAMTTPLIAFATGLTLAYDDFDGVADGFGDVLVVG